MDNPSQNYWQNRARPGAEAPAQDAAPAMDQTPDEALADAINGLRAAQSPTPSANAGAPKVAVLGGGISGLTSAYELAKQGVDVTVIEGSNRLGGHIHTKRNATDNGLYFERGAELIDTNQVAVQKLMGELGVGLVDSSQSTDGDFFHANGQVRSEDELFEAYKPLAMELKKVQSQLRTEDGGWTAFGKELDNVSMENLLDYYSQKGVVEDWVPTMFKQSYSGEIGRDPSKISAVAFLDCIGADVERGLELYGDSDEAYRVQNGTESIINALEDKLRDMGVTIKTSEQVAELENAPNGGMTVHSIKGEASEKQTYDSVVSALPLPALRNIKGVENLGLSDEQMATINETQYCTLTKFAVQTNGKPWQELRAADGSGGNGTVYTDGTFQTAWVSNEGQPNDDLQNPDANGMVTFFVGGTNGQMPTAELVSKAKEEYAAILGKPQSEVFTDAAPVVANWSTESRGCYVAPAPGQYTRLQSFREQSAENFSMVGEYIPVPTERGASIGFMNNAADSAQREAARTVEMLQQRGFGQQQSATQDIQPQQTEMSAEQAAAILPNAEYSDRLSMQQQRAAEAPANQRR